MNSDTTLAANAQPNWAREFLGLLAAGLLGWTVEAWLCRYFWNHDVGIGGGPMLLFGPPMVMVGSFGIYHLLLLATRWRVYARQTGPLVRRLIFRGFGLSLLVASCWVGLWAWGLWIKSVQQSLGRYVPHSKMQIPTALHAIVWLLTLFSFLLVVHIVRDMTRNRK